jgi:PAS domain S-box-containing protein
LLSLPPELARRVLDAAPDAMIIIDAHGRIRFANRQVSVLFGHAHDAIIDLPVEALLPERFRESHLLHRMQYVDNVRARPMGVGQQLLGLRRDGSEFPVEISLSPVQTDSPVLIAAAIRDVTDRKRVEAQLIVARAAAEQLRESADRANQGKSRFLATASHDLRQPLQTLALLHGSLRRLVSDPLAVEALALQERAIASMSRLLNALLDISKLESGSIKPEPGNFEVRALFASLRMEFAGLAASKGLALEFDTGADYLFSDAALVEQILRNLVSNALKYTDRGAVQLRCRHDGTSIRIAVLDSGVGIPEDQLGYIFEEYYQVGVPSNSSREGYGLGLSIVQRLVKLLNLKLEVESQVGRGSCFTLIVPQGSGDAAPAAHSAPWYSADQPGSRLSRVLIVEDDAAVRSATRMLLRVEGYEVVATGSIKEALSVARSGKPVNLVVTDYHLAEGETGTAAIAALRECLGAGLRAVLMTGDTSAAFRELPPDPLVRVANKPIKAGELLALVRQLIDERLE